ncbi:MAG: bifunctional demethylmenaquinone methyltransferase/2-methoxy-6-polyprenyl-1,4-benzoquinol methylase UbiE [Candidatus Rariloculaceae bacterium]
MTDQNNKKNDDDLIDFGFESIPRGEKQDRVRGVFDSVAGRYDIMNDLMSAGLHRSWKRFTVSRSGLRPGDSVLDIAAGSGDLSRGLARQVGPGGTVFVTDINANMLAVGRDRLMDSGLAGNIHYVQANAEQLPFKSAMFDCITIGFGLRNVTDKEAALSSMLRVLKPGGRLLVLEFSKPTLGPLEPIYDFYSLNILPKIGELVLSDGDSYRYLAESIRKHPAQEELKALMVKQGFERCDYLNFSSGIVALHRGYRL